MCVVAHPVLRAQLVHYILAYLVFTHLTFLCTQNIMISRYRSDWFQGYKKVKIIINSYLLDAFLRAGHRVLEAVVLVDHLPKFGEGVVLLQRVGAFGLEVLEHGRLSHRPVNHIRLPGQILERPAVRVTLTSGFKRFEAAGCEGKKTNKNFVVEKVFSSLESTFTYKRLSNILKHK